MLHETEAVFSLDQLLRNSARGDRLRVLEMHYRYDKGREGAAFAIRALWRLLRATGLRRPSVATLSQVLDAWNGHEKDCLGRRAEEPADRGTIP